MATWRRWRPDAIRSGADLECFSTTEGGWKGHARVGCRASEEGVSRRQFSPIARHVGRPDPAWA